MALGVKHVSFALGIFISMTSMSYSEGGLNTEGQLLRKLTDPSVYEKAVRPVKNVSIDTVAVAVRLSIENFHMDSSTETLECFAYAWLEWTDEYMTWNESDYHGLQSVLVPVEQIWLPDMGIFNRIDGDEIFKIRPLAKAILSSNGKIDWVPGGLFVVKCRMKMTKFPFDEQECKIIIGSNAYDSTRLRVVKGAKTIKKTKIVNGEWSYREKEAVELFDYGENLSLWEQYTVTLYFKRKPAFYVLNILIPCVAISFLVLLVFCLPCQSGEKISLSITTLVALTVFQMTTSDSIPKTTNETPILVIYLTTLTAMSAVSTILTVFVLKVFYTPVDQDMSPMFESIVRGLAKITCSITKQKLQSSGSGSTGSQLHSLRTEENPNDIRGKKSPHFATDHDGFLSLEDMRLTWPIAARIIDKFLMYVFVASMFAITSVSLVLICS